MRSGASLTAVGRPRSGRERGSLAKRRRATLIACMGLAVRQLWRLGPARFAGLRALRAPARTKLDGNARRPLSAGWASHSSVARCADGRTNRGGVQRLQLRFVRCERLDPWRGDRLGLDRHRFYPGLRDPSGSQARGDVADGSSRLLDARYSARVVPRIVDLLRRLIARGRGTQLAHPRERKPERAGLLSVGATGIEPVTSGLKGRRPNH